MSGKAPTTPDVERPQGRPPTRLGEARAEALVGAAADAPPPVRRRGGRTVALAVHLARREAAAANRWTLLGWTWPLVRQLAQLAVLVFAFSAVFDLGVEDYPLFVFCGLVAWSWFSVGIGAASMSVVNGRHFTLQPGFPPAVLPLVAITVPLIDVLVAMPVLAAMLVSSDALAWTAVLFPVLLAIQFVLMLGIAWAVAAVSVYLRDVPNLIGVLIATSFYLTPVFYPAARVPEEHRWLMDLNPMAVLLEAYRDVLLDGRVPDWGPLAQLLAVGAVACVAGRLIFRRLSAGFAEEL